MPISEPVARHLGFYVYLLIDPRDQSIFYIGNGKGARVLSHLSDANESKKTARIADMRSDGHEPLIEILAHDLPDQETALRVEAAAIDLVGIGNLTNCVRGWRTKTTGRATLDEIRAIYQKRPVTITEPSLLIRITQFFYGMTDVELYDATRSCWRLGPDREKVQLVFAVNAEIVREVYEVAHWLPGGSTLRQDFPTGIEGHDSRWEFVGRVADESIRARYIDGHVGHFFKHGNQNPLMYLNLG